MIKKIRKSLYNLRKIYYKLVAPFIAFSGSSKYWDLRYKTGGNSGAGSYNKLAEFKAEVLNKFVMDKQIETVIEYGCGDGHQLLLSNYPNYIGFDVSLRVIKQCRDIFSNDDTKYFKLMGAYENETAQLTLSLDVIYHLVEEEVYIEYMKRLFDSSIKYVIVYSSNTNEQAFLQPPYIKHRLFSNWIEKNQPDWKLIEKISNKYPYKKNELNGSFADFYIYEKYDNP